MSQQAVSADEFIQNLAVEIFSPNTEGTNHKQLGFIDKLVPHEFRSLKILGPLSNFKIQQ